MISKTKYLSFASPLFTPVQNAIALADFFQSINLLEVFLKFFHR
ncbi:MAG: hypothetical protein JWR61_4271 [Ferruginibacter sp.]|nr:hypothetical protein [Ferruginibacter sp.]